MGSGPEELDFDLVVAGGGLAGLAAAIAAARGGARVALVQDRPVLGGNSSSEIRVHVGGATASGSRRNVREGGLLEEWRLEDRVRNHQPYDYPHMNSLWDLVLLDAAKREPNLTLFLNTSVREAALARPGRIAGARAVQLGTERDFLFRAPLFCDASGDGTLAFTAGADFRYGREARGEHGESLAPEQADQVCMGASLLFKSLDVGRPVRFEPPAWAEQFPGMESLPFKMTPKLDLRGGYWWVELGGFRPDEHTVTGNERIRDRLLAALLGVWDLIKNRSELPGVENLALEWVGLIPGKREGRRFLGDYVLNENDVRAGRVFPDAVAYGGWSMDLHVPGGLDARDQEPTQFHWFDRVYTIPYRCLYSRNVENLFLAGRLLSASHAAFGSTRVMGTLAAAGQAAGAAAAMCARGSLSPRGLGQERIGELQQRLLREDGHLPSFRNSDRGDLARTAKRITASSSRPAEITEPERFLTLDGRREQIFPVTGPRLEAVEVLLESAVPDPVRLTAELLSAAWGDDFRPAQPLARVTVEVPLGRRWVKLPFGMNLARGLYRVALGAAPELSWGASTLYLPGMAAGRPGQIIGWRPEQSRTGSPRLLATHCLRQVPSSLAYGPENVTGGMSRAESWTELWASDPQEPLPQWIELELERPARLSRVELTFDTNIDRLVDFGPTPECARDYEVEVRLGSAWRKVAEVRGNYQRKRRHDFAPADSDALRITVRATNGAPDARIFEVRAG